MQNRESSTKEKPVIPSINRWVVLFFFIPFCVLSQQPKGTTIPDGTEGEQLETFDADSVPHHWRDKRWRLFPGRFSTLKIGGGFLYEFAGYTQDRVSRQQLDSIGTALEPAFDVRDFRITASGQFKTKRLFTWKAGFMYNGDTKEWLVRETGVMIGVPELWGKFFIGRTKEGFSMNKVMVGYAGWTMERQMAIDVIPILADGIKWLGYLPESRIFWNAGVYGDFLSEGQSFSTYRWQTAFRVGWLPVYDAGNQSVLHVGISYRYGEPDEGTIRVRSRPEANPATYFVDTGVFSSDYSSQWGGEAYYSAGPWMAGSEVYAHHFSSQEADDPVFYGGDAVVSYMITGETRPYNTATAILGFVPVKRPVFKGGPGAWEVLCRFSTYDLTTGTLEGGKFWRITPMVNWYLSKDIRLELAYGYGVLDRFGLKGTTQFFQTRIQLTLL
ncbi:porin [Oscillatoria amoena NRMC-F 0135]|nr:porin [Oscillatoria amoena NRMC-F 0135]